MLFKPVHFYHKSNYSASQSTSLPVSRSYLGHCIKIDRACHKGRQQCALRQEQRTVNGVYTCKTRDHAIASRPPDHDGCGQNGTTATTDSVATPMPAQLIMTDVINKACRWNFTVPLSAMQSGSAIPFYRMQPRSIHHAPWVKKTKKTQNIRPHIHRKCKQHYTQLQVGSERTACCTLALSAKLLRPLSYNKYKIRSKNTHTELASLKYCVNEAGGLEI